MTNINRLNQPGSFQNTTAGSASNAPSNGSEIDLSILFAQLRRNRSLLLGSLLLGLLIGIMVYFSSTRKFTSHTTMMINIEGEAASQQFGDPFGALALMKSESIDPAFAVARSTALLEQVVKEEQLVLVPEFNKTLRDPSWKERTYEVLSPAISAVKEFIGAESALILGDAPWSQPEVLQERLAVEALAARVNITDLQDDLRLRISVRTEDRVRSAEIANTMATKLNAFLKDTKVSALDSALAWINGEAERVEGSLREIEMQINAETSAGSVLPGSDVLGSNAERLVEGELILESNRRRGEALLRLGEVIARIEGGADAQSAFASMPDDLRLELTSDYLEIFRWERRDEPPSPDELQTATLVIQRALDAQASTISRREQEILPVRAYTRKLSTAQNRYLQLKTSYESNTELLKTLRERMAGLQIERAGETQRMTVLEIAEPALMASSPRRTLTLLGGILGGLLIGASIMLFRFFKRDAFLSLEDVEQTFDAPVVSILSDIRRDLRGKFDWYALPTEIQEAYRRAYSAVFVMPDEQGSQALMITSSIPGEGKTTTSLYTAAAAVEEGKRTLVIDLDFRKESVSRYLKIKGKREFGVYSVFRGEATLEEAAQPYEYRPGVSFDVLTTDGRQRSKETDNRETLSVMPVRALIRAAKEQYDVVIVDVPPILAVQDANMVGRMVDAIFCVVSTQDLQKKAALRASTEWKRAGLKLSGLIVRGEKSELYEYYDYSYYHYDYAAKDDGRARRPSQTRRRRSRPGRQQQAAGTARE